MIRTSHTCDSPSSARMMLGPARCPFEYATGGIQGAHKNTPESIKNWSRPPHRPTKGPDVRRI